MSIFSQTNTHLLSILPWPATLTRHEGSFLHTEKTVIVTDEQTEALGIQLVRSLQPALGFSLKRDKATQMHSSMVSLALDTSLSHLGKEGYRLSVTAQQVTLRSPTLQGLFYATQTLRQLFPVEIFATTPQFFPAWHIPAVTIEDTPRFAWRGCLVDSARHFLPKDALLKLIDLLALHKLNVVHLHLTDDQGWRIEIKKYPKLTEIGSHRRETVIGHGARPDGYDTTPHGGYYTQDDLREIVAYATERFVSVLPEIDMPGHAQAAVASYPEIGVTGKPTEVATIWGIHPYLYTPSEEGLQFLRDVLSEVIDIFPSLYIHIGGDEAIKDQWIASEHVQKHIKELGLKDEKELQSWFLTQIGQFLAQHGRKFIGWDEILEGGIPADAAVMSWRGIDGGILAAQQQHSVIMAPYTHVYFDSYQSNDPEEPLAIGRYIPLDAVYTFEPIPEILTAEQAKYILGVEGTLWSEYIKTPQHLEYMLFPRGIALAELAWSPKNARNFSDFRQRLALHEERLTHLHVSFRPVAKLEQEASYPIRKDPMSFYEEIEPHS